MNEQIVDDAFADIAINPEQHDQRTFGEYHGLNGCDSVYCLAGFISARAGYKFVLHYDHDSGCTYQRWVRTRENLPNFHDAYHIARVAAGMSFDEANEMFINSAHDDFKELVTRWNRLTGREIGPLIGPPAMFDEDPDEAA